MFLCPVSSGLLRWIGKWSETEKQTRAEAHTPHLSLCQISSLFLSLCLALSVQSQGADPAPVRNPTNTPFYAGGTVGISAQEPQLVTNSRISKCIL